MDLPRLYPILDTEALTQRTFDWVSAAEAMLEGGARILQFRHKGHYSRSVFEQASKIAELCRSDGVQLIIDDRCDIALLLNAGVHVGQDDLAPRDARRLLPSHTIGFSTHTASQFQSALTERADYLAFGPIFVTRSKADPDPVTGLAALRAIAAHPGRLPLVAIGGISRANAGDVLAAGADSVAVIRDILPDNPDFLALRQRMEEWQRLVKT